MEDEGRKKEEWASRTNGRNMNERDRDIRTRDQHKVNMTALLV